MKLKRMKTKEVTVGDYKFTLRPLPAFDASYIFGDVVSVVMPMLTAITLSGGQDKVDIAKGMDAFQGVSFDANSVIAALSRVDGRTLTSLMKELLLTHNNVSIYDDETNTWSPFTKDDFDEVFCMYIAGALKLCTEVILQNYGNFFSDLGTLFGKLIRDAINKTSESLESLTESK